MPAALKGNSVGNVSLVSDYDGRGGWVTLVSTYIVVFCVVKRQTGRKLSLAGVSGCRQFSYGIFLENGTRMKLLRVIVCVASAMWLATEAVMAAPPKVTKQIVAIKSVAGNSVGKAELVTKTVGKKTTRSLVVKVANFSLPAGTKLVVRIGRSAVATSNVVGEVDNYDTDGDGTLNDVDTDDDGDGINDDLDSDDDDDGIPDSAEDDLDDDGINDFQDDDDDDDGVVDGEEDNDGDGTPDDEDNDDNGDGTDDNEDEVDADGDDDGLPNSEDTDDDDDDIPDDLDTDDDGDGIADTVDPDYATFSGKLLVTKTTGVPAAPKGATLSVHLPNGTLIASGKF